MEATERIFAPRQAQFYVLSAGPVIVGGTAGNLLLEPAVVM
jgi:hypothetical protein